MPEMERCKLIFKFLSVCIYCVTIIIICLIFKKQIIGLLDKAKAELVIELLSVCIWPGIIFLIILIFKKEIRGVLDKAGDFNFEIAGQKFSFTKRLEEATIKNAIDKVNAIQKKDADVHGQDIAMDSSKNKEEQIEEIVRDTADLIEIMPKLRQSDIAILKRFRIGVPLKRKKLLSGYTSHAENASITKLMNFGLLALDDSGFFLTYKGNLIQEILRTTDLEYKRLDV